MIGWKTVPVTPFEQNCTILWCQQTRQAAIVDPGGETEKIHAVLQAEKLQGSKIWLTHAHIDHIGAAAKLARELDDAPIEGPHSEDRFWLDGLAQQGQMFGFAGAEPFEPTRWLNDGDTLEIGAATLQVIHTPGHTPGHVVFYHPEARLALVGDVLFAGSVGRTDFPRGDAETLFRVIRERLFPLGDDITFIPGHGPQSTFGHERLTNPYVGQSR